MPSNAQKLLFRLINIDQTTTDESLQVLTSHNNLHVEKNAATKINIDTQVGGPAKLLIMLNYYINYIFRLVLIWQVRTWHSSSMERERCVSVG